MVNLISLADRLGALDKSSIQCNPERCLRTRYKYSDCHACIDACPVTAIQFDKPLSINQDACTHCGLCLRICPLGAFSSDDGVEDLFTCASSLECVTALELVCAAHPSGEIGPGEIDAAIRTNYCLAALGPSAYTGLYILGSERVAVRLDECKDCPLGSVLPEIKNAITKTQWILAAYGLKAQIAISNVTEPTNWKQRPIYETRNPPLSRRDLFQMFAKRGPRFAARALMAGHDSTERTDLISHERRRLAGVLMHLSLYNTFDPSKSSLEDLGWIRLAAGSDCNACGVCARACPTGALEFTTSEIDQYELLFHPKDCVDCGICLDLCQPAALKREKLLLVDFLAEKHPMLVSGFLKKCRRCGAKVAEVNTDGLCGICDFRRQNPFGSKILTPRKRKHPD